MQVGKSLSLVLLTFATISSSAKVLIDFRGKAKSMRVDSGAFVAGSSVKQLEDVPEGVRVRVDVDCEATPSQWTTVNIAKFGDGDWIGKEFKLYCKEMPKGRIERRCSINMVDKDGEVFELKPKKQGIDSSGRHFQSFIVPESGHSYGGGNKRNGRLDAPVKMSSIVFYYDKVYSSGEATLMRIDSVEDTAVRNVVSRETISTDTTYPGAAPFNGAERLLIEVTPAMNGKATIELVSDPISSAWNGGTRLKFDGVAKNGKMVFETKLPYKKQYEFLKLDIKPDSQSPRGPFRIANAGGEFYQTAAEAMRLDVVTGNNFLHIVRDESERPVLMVKNPTAMAISWQTEFVFSDMFGREFKLPFEREVGGREQVEIAVPWPLPAKGLWKVKAIVKANDGSVAEKETRFAYVDRHEVTPLLEKPKFRIGVHYHGTKYLPNLVDKTLQALVWSGAKFTRTDYNFQFADIAQPDGTYRWETADMMMKKMRDAGLALDIIIANSVAPRWAVDQDAVAARTEERAKRLVLVTRPNVFRDFCEAFARRYNRNVDYYEVGNEWDMHYTKALTNEEAMRMQREAYEGVHKGYPEGAVTPNGWASVTSAANLWGRATENMGIIEEFAAHPELYDSWSMHAHCAPSMFYQRIRRCFLPLREATALKTRPWICSETALSCGFGGELAVGRATWEKILYAWAWGCSDYIWYNLRATGWVEGHEPGYGIITADFYPRSAFAAISALTTIFHGLDADGRIYSEGERHLLRFRGKTADRNFTGIVLAAWDSASDAKPRKIRILTDAKRAEQSDYMGNRTELKIVGGVVEIEMSLDPSAYLFYGATRAEAANLNEIADSRIVTRVIDSRDRERTADFVLDSMDQVRDYYQALPQYVRRTWGGQSDHSARIWLDRVDRGEIRVCAKVQDDIRGPEDAIEVYLAPVGGKLEKYLIKPTSRQGCIDFYDSVLPFNEKVFDFTVHALEDDGDGGLDGYLQLTGDSEPPKRIELR